MYDPDVVVRTSWFDRLLSITLIGLFGLSIYQAYQSELRSARQIENQRKEEQRLLNDNRRLIEDQRRHEEETLRWMLQSVNAVRQEQGLNPLPGPAFQAPPDAETAEGDEKR